MKRFVSVAVLAAPLFGCIFVPEYEPPATGDMARVMFVNDAQRDAEVILYGDAAECRNRSNFKPALVPGARNATIVAANRDLAFSIDTEAGHVYCMSTRSFRPEPGKSYEIHFEEHDEGCSVYGMEARRHIPLTQREWIRASDETGSFCAPLN